MTVLLNSWRQKGSKLSQRTKPIGRQGRREESCYLEKRGARPARVLLTATRKLSGVDPDSSGTDL